MGAQIMNRDLRVCRLKAYYLICKKSKIRKKAYEGQTFTSNGITFDVSLVWSHCEDMKPKKYKSSSFFHHLKNKCWSVGSKRVSPEEIIKSKDEESEHMIRIRRANLEFPIVIWSEEFLENGEIKKQEHVVDGLHRISKAYIDDIKNIDVIFLENKDMRDILIDQTIPTFEDLVKVNLDLSKVFLDNPIGSEKGFGSKKRKLPFDYGEFSKFINPSDDMGWDIIVVPSNSSGIINQDKHDYVIVGIVEVNEDENTWREKADKKPPYGNHKVIVANFGEYSEEDVMIINNFFKNMWQFKNPKFF